MGWLWFMYQKWMHYCELLESVPVPGRHFHTFFNTNTHTHTQHHRNTERLLNIENFKCVHEAPCLTLCLLFSCRCFFFFFFVSLSRTSRSEKSFRWSSPPLWGIDYRLPSWRINVVLKERWLEKTLENRERERRLDRENERLIDGSDVAVKMIYTGVKTWGF